MVLMPFSEPSHVPLLLDGRKIQTTRLQKNRVIKVEDVLHCYYKPRLKKGCSNCIHGYGGKCSLDPYEQRLCLDNGYYHKNFFGTAQVTELIPLNQALNDREGWAVADGFKNFVEADKWFSARSRAGPDWVQLPYVVIRFEPGWVINVEEFNAQSAGYVRIEKGNNKAEEPMEG